MSPLRYLCALALLLASCARPAYQEQGWASVIASQYAGRLTTSGQPYYPQAYTAAHTSLPFGTELTVKNLYTQRSVTVTVNDRFPYYPGRVVNLSSAAAQQLGIPYMQLAQVQVTAYKLPNPGTGYAAQPTYAQQPAYATQQQPYAAQPQYAQPSYNQQPYQQPAYSQSAPSYPTQQQTYAPQPVAPRPATPTYTTPKYVAPKPSYSAPVGGAPNAPAFNGSGGPPPGLQTF